MTIEEYRNRIGNKTREKTILNWLNMGYIPGAEKNAKTGKWNIPKSARKPFTGAKANSKSSNRTIYNSILRACSKRYYICHKFYNGLTEKEFLGYINDLEKAKLIRKATEDGITYYDTTVEYEKNKNNGEKIFKVIELIAGKIA